MGEEDLANRSALNYASKIKSDILILHGAGDQNAPLGQAQAFAEALRKAGVGVEFDVFPGVNHQIPLPKRQPIINAFLKRTLGLTQELPQ
jgi:dipeptidyl aminopeptidase/acylaminoacyl peptidase